MPSILLKIYFFGSSITLAGSSSMLELLETIRNSGEYTYDKIYTIGYYSGFYNYLQEKNSAFGGRLNFAK